MMHSPVKRPTTNIELLLILDDDILTSDDVDEIASIIAEWVVESAYEDQEIPGYKKERTHGGGA